MQGFGITTARCRFHCHRHPHPTSMKAAIYTGVGGPEVLKVVEVRAALDVLALPGRLTRGLAVDLLRTEQRQSFVELCVMQGVALPGKPKKGQVLVKVAAAACNPLDPKVRSNHFLPGFAMRAMGNTWPPREGER